MMNRLLLPAAACIAMLISCTGNKSTAETSVQATTAGADLRGKWYIENIVINDSTYVRPEEEVPGVAQYVIFDDSTYFIQTNCNSISGTYVVNGNSITLGDGAMTEMACDNMATEDLLRQVLPLIKTIDEENDSIVRLNSLSGPEYIVMRKAAEKQ